MMKFRAAVALLFLLPAALFAQTLAKPVAQTKAPVGKRADTHAAGGRRMAVNLEVAALSPADLAIAQRVYQGKLPCEMGAFVTLKADPTLPGYFYLQMKGMRYHMQPVQTTTGAVRLEDMRTGAVWLQLTNKSMLMNQKLGQRLADACVSPEQVVVSEAQQRDPSPGLFDAPAVVAGK